MNSGPIIAFDSGIEFWAEIEEAFCPCQGTGWANRDSQWVECPMHFSGQLHPESRLLLLDDEDTLTKEEHNSSLRWKIARLQEKQLLLQHQLQETERAINFLNLELVNKTPTIKMKAVRPDDPTLDIDEVDYSESL